MGDLSRRWGPAAILVLAALTVSPLSLQGKEEADGSKGLLEKVGIEQSTKPDPAPVFTLPTLEGEKVSLEDFAGTILLVHFWATWSKTAPREMRSLKKLQEALAGQPFKVITVAMDVMGKSAVEPFLKKYPDEFPVVLLDSGGATLQAYSLRAVPTSLLVDGQGRVVGRAVGERLWGGAQMVEVFKKLVKDPGYYGIMARSLSVENSKRSR